MKIRYKIFLVILILLFIDSYGQKSNTYNHLTESEIEWLNQNKNSIKYAPNPFGLLWTILMRMETIRD